MTLVLRKSVGRFSAGTAITLVSQTENNCYDVEAEYTHVEWYTDYNYQRQQRRESRKVTFEVNGNDILIRRKASDMVPAIPRAQRDDRVAKRELWRLTSK